MAAPKASVDTDLPSAGQLSRLSNKMKSSVLRSLLLPLALAGSHNAIGQTIRAKVVVNPAQSLGVMAPEALGVAAAVWDKYLTDPAVTALIKDAGFKVIRYPGGSLSDIYHWKTHSLTKGAHADVYPNTQFDRYMEVVKATGTTPLITANYGSNADATGGGDSAEAAEWVRYANRTKHYHIKYWEIGNEIPGNGFYNGKGWEEDLHAPDTGKKEDRQFKAELGPVAYANNVNLFVKAMKAEDPSIKIGIVLNDPGSWPDGIEPDWNTNVLKICGQNVDFVIVHWYAWGRTSKEVLNSIGDVPKLMASLKESLKKYCGDHAKDLQIWMTEGDASGYNTRHPGALFAADHFLTWWESGATHVDWWNIHNGATRAPDGHFDDQGILSNASIVGDQHEPELNTPFPPYFGVRMVNEMVRPGDTFVPSESDSSDLKVHASKGKRGALSVMLINRDPEHGIDATLDLTDFSAKPNIVQYAYGPGQTELKKTTWKAPNGDLHVVVPPYTIVVLKLSPAKRAK